MRLILGFVLAFAIGAVCARLDVSRIYMERDRNWEFV
jgi:hypothetical protein